LAALVLTVLLMAGCAHPAARALVVIGGAAAAGGTVTAAATKDNPPVQRGAIVAAGFGLVFLLTAAFVESFSKASFNVH
jgi:hypothetical protein